jgi:hypothetical protein
LPTFSSSAGRTAPAPEYFFVLFGVGLTLVAIPLVRLRRADVLLRRLPFRLSGLSSLSPLA